MARPYQPRPIRYPRVIRNRGLRSHRPPLPARLGGKVPPRDAFGDRNGARVRATREGSTPRCNCEILGRTLAEPHRRCMFFRFPPDARWNPERSVVEFGIGIGEYEGVVRVSRRVFQILLTEAHTPQRC